MRIYDVIRRDRAILSSYVSRLTGNPYSKDINQIISDFVDFLNAHMAAKQEALYGPLRHHHAIGSLFWDAYVRREILRNTATQLINADPASEVWNAYLKALAEHIEDYFRAEEQEITSHVSAFLDFPTEKHMGHEMKKLRNKYLGEKPDHEPKIVSALNSVH